jgi:hypothetical protein
MIKIRDKPQLIARIIIPPVLRKKLGTEKEIGKVVSLTTPSEKGIALRGIGLTEPSPQKNIKKNFLEKEGTSSKWEPPLAWA